MPAGIIGRRNTKHRRNRRMSGQNTVPVKATPIAVVSVAVDGSTVTVTFDQAVVLKGIPKFTTNLGSAVATAATQPTPNTVDLVFGAGVIATLNVPFQDPGVRNTSGGYVLAGAYSVA